MRTITIKEKEYVLVNERIKHFRQNYKNWSLESDIISLDNGVCVIKATIKDENGTVKATGLAYEKENSTFINKTSYIENCETSAWGRALGNLGIGIDTSIASAEEVQNAVLNQDLGDQNNDADILAGVDTCNTLAELSAYYNEYSKKVSDKTTLNRRVNQRKRAINV